MAIDFRKDSGAPAQLIINDGVEHVYTYIVHEHSNG